MSQTELVLPFIYTPTVGEACTRYHELMQRPQVGGASARCVRRPARAQPGLALASPQQLLRPDGDRAPQEPKLRPNGLFLSLSDKGKILDKLRSWPQQTVSGPTAATHPHLAYLACPPA